MTSNNDYFVRTFEEGDDKLFEVLVSGLAGQECSDWRKGYGRTGSIHFGPLRPKTRMWPGSTDSDQGQWIVMLSDCERALTLSSGMELSSVGSGDDAVIGRLSDLRGLHLQSVVLDAETLSLTMRLSENNSLILQTDPNSTARDEQWAIELPIGLAIVAFGERHWSLTRNR